MTQDINLRNIKIDDAFWSARQDLVKNVAIPYQEAVLNDQVEGIEKSHAIANFRIAAGLEKGEFYGFVFQDSDLAKWLEGVAYSLIVSPDPELEERADAIIDVIAKAQQPDGYLNTYFTIKEPQRRWQNLHQCHELYCAGHMMEAAVAYYEATGKDKLLKVMCRMADHIDSKFGPDKEHGIPGHEEVEIGLMKLYRATGEERYANLAKYFIDERGQDPEYFKREKEKRGWNHFDDDPDWHEYNQYHKPVRQQDTAEGHSVRAMYLYTAMADIAAQYGDEELAEACRKIWKNATEKRMYITAGIGSTVKGEAFTIDYDLPNDTVYAETCASIGLVFFARKMLELETKGEYADVMERALYNGILSGMQLDGKKFFYVNPLEVNPGVSGKLFGHKHVLPERPGWYACACCPPNVVRLYMSLGKYAWGQDADTIYSHLFVGGDASFDKADIHVDSLYPWEGDVTYKVAAKTEAPFTLAIRIPGYAKNVTVTLNGETISADTKDGYLYMNRIFGKEDTIRVTFPLPVRRVYANGNVRADAGCVALMRGPIVYTFEGQDNGGKLQQLRIPADAAIDTCIEVEGKLAGMTLLTFTGERVITSDALYSEERPRVEAEMMTAIPYFAWGNRGLNQMRVWMREI